MLLLAPALAGVVLEAQESPPLPEHPPVAELLVDATAPDGPFAPALRADSRDHLAHLTAPTVYAISERYDENRLEVAMEVAYTNRTQGSLEALPFWVLPDGVGEGIVTLEGAAVDGKPVFAVLDDSQLVVPFGRRLEPGQRATITLDLTLKVPWVRDFDNDHADGRFGYDSTHAIHLGNALPVALAVPDDGQWGLVKVGPVGEYTGFEQSLFHVTLDAPLDATVLTTGSTVRREEREDRQILTSVAVAREFATTLLYGYTSVSADIDGTRLVAYGPDDGHFEHQAIVAASALRWFSERYGPLPFAELEMSESPMRNIDGIEHCGLVNIGHGWTHDSGGPTVDSRRFEDVTVVHEVAHQWWYGHVGNDAQAEAWLDEGLATASTYAYGATHYGTFADDWRNWLPDPADPKWSTGEYAGIQHPASTFQRRAYYQASYGIGALFLEGARSQLGDEAYFRALRRYHDARHCQIAHAQDLLDALLAEASDPVALRASWDRLVIGTGTGPRIIRSEDLGFSDED